MAYFDTLGGSGVGQDPLKAIRGTAPTLGGSPLAGVTPPQPSQNPVGANPAPPQPTQQPPAVAMPGQAAPEAATAAAPAAPASPVTVNFGAQEAGAAAVPQPITAPPPIAAGAGTGGDGPPPGDDGTGDQPPPTGGPPPVEEPKEETADTTDASADPWENFDKSIFGEGQNFDFSVRPWTLGQADGKYDDFIMMFAPAELDSGDGAKLAIAKYREMFPELTGKGDRSATDMEILNLVRTLLGRTDFAPGGTDLKYFGLESPPEGYWKEQSNYTQYTPQELQQYIKELSGMGGMGGGKGKGGGKGGGANSAGGISAELQRILSLGPDYVDYDRITGEMKNHREQMVPFREGARRRLLADLASRGIDPNSPLGVEALRELDSEVSGHIISGFRDITNAAHDRASERYMQALGLATQENIANKQLGLGYATLRENMKLGYAQLNVQATIADNQMMLQGLALQQDFQKFMASHGLSVAQFEFAQRQAAKGDVTALLAILNQWLATIRGGTAAEN